MKFSNILFLLLETNVEKKKTQNSTEPKFKNFTSARTLWLYGSKIVCLAIVLKIS